MSQIAPCDSFRNTPPPLNLNAPVIPEVGRLGAQVSVRPAFAKLSA
jgi:hypothetical protein